MYNTRPVRVSLSRHFVCFLTLCEVHCRGSYGQESPWGQPYSVTHSREAEPSWNVIAHDDAREEKWRGNWRMEWVASTPHTTSEHGVSSTTTITTADAHTSAASSRLNWRPRRFKWTRPFRRKMKSGFCACAITFQLACAEFYHQRIALITEYEGTHTCFGCYL